MRYTKRTLFVGLFLFATLTCNAQLLWRISGKDLPGDSFLFGTKHDEAIGFCDNRPGFDEAFRSVGQAYFEIAFKDIPETADPRASQFMPNGKSLTSLYDKEQMSVVLDYIARVTGVRYGQVNFTPRGLSVFLQSFLARKAFPDKNPETDMLMEETLQSRAEAMGIPVHGLETFAFQMDFLYGKSLEEQAMELLESLKSPASDPDSLVANMRALAKAYENEDLAVLEQLFSPQRPTSFATELLDDRNATWIPIMTAAMNERPTFFAVGAGHLLGENGLISLLRKQGYTLTPVPVQ